MYQISDFIYDVKFRLRQLMFGAVLTISEHGHAKWANAIINRDIAVRHAEALSRVATDPQLNDFLDDFDGIDCMSDKAFQLWVDMRHPGLSQDIRDEVLAGLRAGTI